jgi:hypothetical protein
MTLIEEKREIPNYPLYVITKSGIPYSKQSGLWKKLKPCMIGGRYLGFVVRNNKKPKTMHLHRALALAWIPNPENKQQVNHIDCNKMNNDINNLEWVTASENTRHAWENKRMDKKNPVRLAALAISARNPKPSLRVLSSEEVAYIRKNYKRRSRVNGAPALAKRFNVAHTTIFKAIKNENFKTKDKNG